MKRTYLKSFAVSLSVALAGTTAVASTIPNSSNLNVTRSSIDPLVLEPAAQPETVQLAQHSSHVSHASHASHASHCSSLSYC